MKIIDSKGRLFGKINLIDFIVVIGFILILVVGLKLFLQKDTVKTEWKYVKVSAKKMPMETILTLNKGETVLRNGEIVLELLDFYYDSNLGVVLYLKVFTEKRNDKNYFNGKELLVGDAYTVESNTFLIKGTLIGIADDSQDIIEKTIEKKITLLVLKEYDWMIDSISIGDKELSRDNKVIVEIIGKKVEPSQMIITTDDGSVIIRDHPILKDIYLDLKIQAIDENEKLYYKDREIKIGNNLKITTEKVFFQGTIINIYD